MHFRRVAWIGFAAMVAAWGSLGVNVGQGERAGPLWLAIYLTFGACTAWLSWPPLDDARARGWRVVLLVQVSCGLALFTMDRWGFSGVALVLAAVELSSYLSLRAAAWAIAAQTVLGCTIAELVEPVGLRPVISIAFAYLGFQIFAMLMIHALRSEEQARTAAELAQSALRDAQAKLAERWRDEERLRIARDLHDTLGHQLTALALNLEVAAHTTSGPASEQVGLCRDLAKGLLADVREVVGALREPRPARLAERILDRVPGLPRPELRLSIDSDLQVDDDHAEAIARLVQESLTNSARHGDAAVLRVKVERSRKRLDVTATDDGAGCPTVVAGHGLRGMRERFEALGGGVSFCGSDGFVVRGWLPGTPG